MSLQIPDQTIGGGCMGTADYPWGRRAPRPSERTEQGFHLRRRRRGARVNRRLTARVVHFLFHRLSFRDYDAERAKDNKERIVELGILAAGSVQGKNITIGKGREYNWKINGINGS